MSDLAQNPPAVRTVLAGLMLSIFLSALDQTIVAVSLPAISADFADLDLLAWVISAYMVAMTVSMPIYGKLGDLYGRRRLMLFAIVVVRNTYRPFRNWSSGISASTWESTSTRVAWASPRHT